MSAEIRHELVAMCDAIRHRGPDDEGQFFAPGVALGMRRLSVIDVMGGQQPVTNESRSVHVVFNGEIYNYRELRRQLKRRGHSLTTHGDTETLVHLYEEDGDRLVHALRGMFAFAIWDAQRRRLLLARDRLGIKPLYYWKTPHGLAFGSELRSLLSLKNFPRQLDRRAMGYYLALGYVPDPLSVFAGVSKLPPGHILTWDQERGVEVVRYWSPVRAAASNVDEREAVEELRRLLDDAVGCHLESDVPLGAFLSGGLDSSAVVAHMSRRLSRAVQTFSIGFDDDDFNEAPHAARVARALGTEHREAIVRPDADAVIEAIVRGFDEPFGDSSALPTFLVSQLARQHVTVSLSGDGGDELFAGYTRYPEVVDHIEIRPLLLRALLHRAAGSRPHAWPGRNRLLALTRTRWGRYATTVAVPPEMREGGVALPDVAAEIASLDHLLDPWISDSNDREFATRMMLADISTYLPGDILTKVDRMSMSVSLEARVPLLDHHLVEFALSLPAHLSLRDGRGKWLFRQAIADVVPSMVLEQPKRGFAVPLGRWFRRELSYRVDALLRSDSAIYNYVDPSAVRRIAGEHARSRRDHGHLLWRLLVLHLWLECLTRGELARPSGRELDVVAYAHAL